jgi:hypothetical protein
MRHSDKVKVEATNIKLKTKHEFDSMLQAQERTGVNRNSIRLCCYGVRRTAGGYTWKYMDKTIVVEEPEPVVEPKVTVVKPRSEFTNGLLGERILAEMVAANEQKIMDKKGTRLSPSPQIASFDNTVAAEGLITDSLEELGTVIGKIEVEEHGDDFMLVVPDEKVDPMDEWLKKLK